MENNTKRTNISFGDVMGGVSEPTLDPIGDSINQEIAEYRASHPGAQERYEEWLRTHNLEDYDSVPEDLAEVMEDGTLRPCSEEERQNFRRL